MEVKEMNNNIPKVKLGIIAVSRDCFPIDLSIRRREAIVKAVDGGIYECLCNRWLECP